MSWVYSAERRFRWSTRGRIMQERATPWEPGAEYVTLPPVPKNWHDPRPQVKKRARPPKTFFEEFSIARIEG